MNCSIPTVLDGRWRIATNAVPNVFIHLAPPCAVPRIRRVSTSNFVENYDFYVVSDLGIAYVAVFLRQIFNVFSTHMVQWVGLD
jgi:hypothetical protein